MLTMNHYLHLNLSRISHFLTCWSDLKDDLSRFQIITKVSYPNKSDRWTNAKREVDEGWYYWQTGLKLYRYIVDP
jgi:hypothetical protein